MPALMNHLRLASCNTLASSRHHVSLAARRPSARPRPSDPGRADVITRARLPGDEKEQGLASFLSEAEEQRLIAFSLSIGISGTISVLGSRLAGIELFSSLHWKAERIDDFTLALLYVAPLLLLDAVALLPKYHTAPQPTEKQKHSEQKSTDDSNQKQLALLRSDLLPASGLLGDIRASSTLYQIVAAGVPEESRMSKPAKLSLELSYIWLRDFASELLQRGLLVTFLAAWLQDRAFEAGLDDVAFTASGQLPVYTSELTLWIAAAMNLLLVMPAVISQANASSAAVATSAAYVAVQGEATDEKLDSWLTEWRMIEALGIQEKALPAQAAYGITLVRGILRHSLLNAIFVSTGNLAASLLLAMLSDSLLFAYCEQGRAKLPSLKMDEDVTM